MAIKDKCPRCGGEGHMVLIRISERTLKKIRHELPVELKSENVPCGRCFGDGFVYYKEKGEKP